MSFFFSRNINKNVTYASITSFGNREINEDSIGCFDDGNNQCFIVCDGLGGHGMGDVASKLVVEVFEDRFNSSATFFSNLGESFKAAQDILMAEQTVRRASRKMKTTAAVCAIDNKKVYVGFIGDSRVYIFKNDSIEKRTLDHSVPQMLSISGEITEDQIRGHSERNVLLRVLGVEWNQEMYELMKPIPLGKVQAVLVCSDGFWELINESEMESTLREATSPNEWLNSMIKVVEKNGEGTNMDNFSAIAIWNQ